MDAIRILVVDDDQTANDALVELLELDGFSVMSARDGREALELGSTFEPAVVITDVEMPVMDGADLVARLAATNGPPAIVVSAFHGERVRHALAAGAVDFIPKPIDYQRIRTAIDAAITARTGD